MSDRVTFRLPGHEINPLAERKCLLSLLAAYSRQWNPRNLEAPWYEAWTQIFGDLVARHASLSVAPQPYLWYDLAIQAHEGHTTPGPHYLLYTEDEQLDESEDDVGNMTLDSIMSVSVPSNRNIAITRKVSFPRPRNTSQFLHLSRRVTYVGIPLLAELKASGPRCNNIRTSLSTAAMPMSLAREQVVKQALHLFQMYPHQDSVMLVAITGFWWSYRIFSRVEANGMVVDEDEEECEQVEEPDAMLQDQNGIHPNPARIQLGLPDEQSAQFTQEELYGFNFSVLGNAPAEEAQFHTVLLGDRMELREGGSSDYILYGTAPSNQVLSLILDRLDAVVHVHYEGRMG